MLIINKSVVLEVEEQKCSLREGPSSPAAERDGEISFLKNRSRGN
jgi:hypothetical protein